MNASPVSAMHARLHRTGVVAVLVLDDADDAVPLARALLAGGLDCMEVTLRTPAALEGLGRIVHDVPGMLAGVGTVLTPTQVREVKAAGGAFGVAPGLSPAVVHEAERVGLPFVPGVCTPSEIEHALELGCRVLKFFPAEQSGGLPYLRSIAAPYAHLGVHYIPLGGVSAADAENYLRMPDVLALGGTWLAPRDLIRRQDWPAVTARAAEATAIVRRVRGAVT